MSWRSANGPSPRGVARPWHPRPCVERAGGLDVALMVHAEAALVAQAVAVLLAGWCRMWLRQVATGNDAKDRYEQSGDGGKDHDNRNQNTSSNGVHGGFSFEYVGE